MGKQPYVELRAEHVVKHVVMVYLGFFLVRDQLVKCDGSVSTSWCEGSAFAQFMVQYDVFSFWE